MQILKRLGQPSVVAEMLAGVLLGPTALGQIPGFTEAMFPSTETLSVVANFALILFMFLVGIQLEIEEIRANMRLVPVISLTSFAVCFGMSCGLAVGFSSDAYLGDRGGYGPLVLVLGLLTSTSALPVLARILSERNMLHQRIGSLSLAVAVFDDLVGWILVAVMGVVSRSSGGEGGSRLTILWTLLLILAHGLIVYFLVRPAMAYLAKRSVVKNAVSANKFLGVMMLLIGTSYMTEAIGISPLIGALEVGLLTPRNTPLAAAIPTMLEHLVTVVLMPLFFVLSGLRTQFGLIDSWEAAGLAVAVILLATSCKMIGVFSSSTLCGIPWRTSILLSALLSTKGLVALIIANQALDFGIVSQRMFSVLSLMILVTTMGTTPLIWLIEPLRRRGLAEGQDPDDSPKLASAFVASSDLHSFIDDVDPYKIVLEGDGDLSELDMDAVRRIVSMAVPSVRTKDDGAPAQNPFATPQSSNVGAVADDADGEAMDAVDNSGDNAQHIADDRDTSIAVDGSQIASNGVLHRAPSSSEMLYRQLAASPDRSIPGQAVTLVFHGYHGSEAPIRVLTRAATIGGSGLNRRPAPATTSSLSRRRDMMASTGADLRHTSHNRDSVGGGAGGRGRTATESALTSSLLSTPPSSPPASAAGGASPAAFGFPGGSSRNITSPAAHQPQRLHATPSFASPRRAGLAALGGLPPIGGGRSVSSQSNSDGNHSGDGMLGGPSSVSGGGAALFRSVSTGDQPLSGGGKRRPAPRTWTSLRSAFRRGGEDDARGAADHRVEVGNPRPPADEGTSLLAKV